MKRAAVGYLDEPGPLSGMQGDLGLLLDGAPNLETTANLDAPRLLLRRPSRRRNLSALRQEVLEDFYTFLPEAGESLHLVSNGKFDYWMFVPATLALLGRPAEQLYASTWTMSRSNVLDLFRLLDAGQLQTAAVLTGTYFKRRETAVANTLISGLAERGLRYRAFANHAKVLLLAAPPAYLSIEGSANLTSNPRLEQTVVTNDRDLYQFHRAWFEEMLGAE
jgi:hypothetical protein